MSNPEPNMLQMMARLRTQQQDPRTAKWLAWQRQINLDSNNGNIPPPDMPSNIPMAQFEQFHKITPQTLQGPVVQAQPMAPGQYDDMMRQKMLSDLIARSKASPQGKTRASHFARENRDFAVTKDYINHAVMPAEVSPMGQIPGSLGNWLANVAMGNVYPTDY